MGIQKNDLRIGNLVSVNGEGVYKISGIGGEKGLGIQNIDGSLPKGLPDGWKITPIGRYIKIGRY